MALATVTPALAQTGIASTYTTKENGRTTASGIPFHDHALTAASRTLPLRSQARVTNRRNGRSVIVKITDRGPYVAGRIIDLSTAAAKAIVLGGLSLVDVTLLR